ncbi:MAG: DUF1730 domain-containing protein, partial [Deltaproteobacteria bacterium]|nr:DUF1730 domain-containing protein [Deltaproteobacteria bacterium]
MLPPSAPSVLNALGDLARGLGLVAIGAAPAEPFTEAGERLRQFRERGLAGPLDYLRGPDDRADPRALLPAARAVLVAALPHPDPDAPPGDDPSASPRGRVAAYARGDDYHRVLKDRLAALVAGLEELLGRRVVHRICVDTAPLLEREAARLAGLGFIGKNGLLIIPGQGSRVLLGEVLVDVE